MRTQIPEDVSGGKGPGEGGDPLENPGAEILGPSNFVKRERCLLVSL